MRTCKRCGKIIPERNFGLRKFCSNTCKIAYRKEYLKQRKRNSKGSYVNIDPNTGTVPDGFYEATEGKNKPEVLNPEELKVAKECCNYEMKKKVGYCITLYGPYYAFKTYCRDCYIFFCLKQSLTFKRGKVWKRFYKN